MGRGAWLVVTCLAGVSCHSDHRTGEAAASGGIAEPAQPAAALPASDRVFVAACPSGDLVLGADKTELWAAETTDAGSSWRVRWKEHGEGVVQLVTAGDFGRGPHVYAARGRGRGLRDAPLTLEEIDCATGRSSELWRFTGPRTDAAHLSIGDVDRDGAPELAFAYYATNYDVRTRHLAKGDRVIEGPPIRMASSRAYADVDGDGKVDEIVGRLYGDSADAPGDLRVDMGKGWVAIPTDRGVRAIATATEEGHAVIYFADGWAKDYGHDARAQLKRARWTNGAFAVDSLGASPDEYALFELTPLDPLPSGLHAVAARGNRRLNVFEPSASGPWTRREGAPTGEVLATAVRRATSGRWELFVPGASETARVAVP